MSDWLISKAAGFSRRVLPELRSDYEVADFARKYCIPAPPAEPDPLRNVSRSRPFARGIDLQIDRQLERLKSWGSSRHQDLFKQLREDDELQIASNGFFFTPDAEVYASMILDREPRRIVEVGSGYSTLIARKTIRYAGYSTRLEAIDPHPRTNVKAATDALTLSPVEDSQLLNFEWDPKDILFIDSSHICRTRGDLPYLYCQVLPSLPSGMLIHVHDVFLPYDYPNLYDPWCYSEVYLVACLLAYSSRYRTVFANHMMSREHTGPMRETFGPIVANEEKTHHFGASYWFEIL